MAAATCAVSFRNSFGVSKPSDLGFVTSQLSGLRIFKLLPTPLTLTPPLPIVARRVCPFTGKKSNRANKVSFSNHKTKKLQFVNLQYKRIWWEAGKRYVKLRLSTKAYPLYLTCVAHESSSAAWKISKFFLELL